jgi:hypothetical protein
MQIYGIERTVYEVLDVHCAHLVASKHFDSSVHVRLNNALVGGNLSGEGLYPIMYKRGDDVCGIEWHSRNPSKCEPRYDAARAVPAKDLNNI